MQCSLDKKKNQTRTIWLVETVFLLVDFGATREEIANLLKSSFIVINKRTLVLVSTTHI